MDVDGTPLRPPATNRRIFATETVNGGLPIHIAANLLGHLDLNTTRSVSQSTRPIRRHHKLEILPQGILLRCLGCLAGLGDWLSGAGQGGRLFEHKLRSGRSGPSSVSRSTYAQRLLQVNF